MATKTNRKANVPNLRFPGFEEEWQYKTLRDVTKLITKGTTPARFVDQGIKFIKIECFVGDKIDEQKCLFIDELTHNKELKRSALKENDLLFAIAGATIGKINIVHSAILPANTNQALAIIRLKEHEDSKFIYQILKSDSMKKYIRDSISVGAQPNLNLEQMNDYSFFQPSLAEQRKIASILSLLDSRIQTQNKIIEYLESLIKILREKLFAQQIRFKPREDKSFSDWKKFKLGDIGEVVGGLTYSPNDITSKGVLVLRSSNVQRRTLSFEDCVYVNVNSYNPVMEDDILICVRNGSKDLIGKNALVKKEHEGYAFGAFMAVYRSKLNKFIYQWFDTNEYKAEVNKNLGATINSINGTDLKKFTVAIPEEAEQMKIAKILFLIDKKVETEVKLLKKYKIQKKYFLEKIFI